MTQAQALAQDMQGICIALCEHLRLVPPFSAIELSDRIADERSCFIYVASRRLPGTIFGVCARLRGAYAILYRADGSMAHQERIIFHELGHIVLGHLRQTERILVLREGLTSTTEEHEAEAFAEFMTTYALFGTALTSTVKDGTPASTEKDAGKKSPFGRWMERVTR